MNYETGRENLVKLINWYNENSVKNRNEANTRFHIIDRLIFECLGWDKNTFTSEESQGGKYADYTFSNPNRCLIIEAKKEGVYFELPAGWDKIEYKINTLRKDNHAIGEAINQAIEYCQSRGVQFGAVSNGTQLIAFLASRNDGISPLEGKAIVFDSLTSMERNFLLMWQYLSQEGIREKRILSKLIDNNIILLPPKLSSQLTS
ncbi:MAG TPA: hypothetical protein VLB84_17710, partial [Bacteroidia bacterium]|nr:hypothetical protein [Bacteroidia bacterium]